VRRGLPPLEGSKPGRSGGGGMSLFASKRKKATEAATAGLRPLIAAAQCDSGISNMTYRDPYVLGFLHTTAGLFAQAATRGKANTEDVGFAIHDSLATVSNLNGSMLSDCASSYFGKKDRKWLEAVEHAMVYFYYTFQIMQNEDEHPLVREASQTARFYLTSGIGSDYRSAVGSALLDKTLFGRIEELQGRPGNA
ncbi:MAG: hypothetical protein ACR2FJ_06705, partial [Qipengyuania sp.]